MMRVVGRVVTRVVEWVDAKVVKMAAMKAALCAV